MKKTLIYTCICGAAAAMCACSNSEEPQTVTPEQTVTLSVELSMGSRADRLQALPSKSDYIVSCNKQVSKVNYLDGVSTIVNPITLSKDNDKVTAFYPWTSENEKYVNEEHAIPVFVDGTDYMYGYGASYVNVYNPRTTINMYHGMSYVKLNIVPNQYLAADILNDIKIKEVSISNVSMSGVMDANGVTYWNPANGSMDFALADGDLSKGSVIAESYCMPYNSSDRTDKVLYIIHTLSAEPIAIKVPYRNWNPAAGRVCTYTVYIDGKHEGTLSTSVSVQKWNEVSPVNFTVK